MNLHFARLALALGAPLVGGPAFASDLFVPGSFATIQDAIDAAVDGDRIVVAPGTYSEFLDFQSKAITLESSDPADPAIVATTIIDGGNDESLAGFPQNPGTGLRISFAAGTAELRGLTIRNFADDFSGYPAAVEAVGNANFVIDRCRFVDNIGNGGAAGGVFLQGTATIVDSTFEGNAADGGYGGGLHLDGRDFTVTGCTFTGNRSFGGAGGSIALTSSGDALIANCTFAANEGGVYVNGFADADVIDCTFTNNVANGSVGAGIRVDGALATIVGCSFSGNQALGGSGAALYLDGTSQVTIDSCDLRSNVASSGSGAGVSVLDSAVVSIVDTVFFGHSTPSGSGSALNLANDSQTTLERTTIAGGLGSAAAIRLRDSAALVAKNTILWNHTSTFSITGLATTSFTYSNIQVAQPGLGNISLPPNFRSLATGDLRLVATSPSIDAGDPLDLPAETDPFGDSRVLDGNLDLVLRVDQGFDEYAPSRLSVTGTPTPGGSIDVNWSAAPGTFFLGYLIYGTTPTAIVLDPVGTLFIDPFLGVVLTWPAAPSNVTVNLSPSLTPGPTVYLQAVGVALTGLTCTNLASFTLQ